MGYFILAPVLLADYKSAETSGASILRRRSCGFEIRRQKKGSTYFFADLKSAETGERGN